MGSPRAISRGVITLTSGMKMMCFGKLYAGMRGIALATAMVIVPDISHHARPRADVGHILAQIVPPTCDPTDPLGGCYDFGDIHRG